MKKGCGGGFTLIEVVVTVGIVGIVLAVSGMVMTNSLRSSTRTESTSKLENAATWIMSEIKRNVLMAAPGTLSCPNGSSFVLTGLDDKATTISCVESPASTSRIASDSEHPAQINPPNVRVKGCDTFVRCISDPSDASRVSAIEVGFTLFVGDDPGNVDSFYQNSFISRVTVRN